MKTIEQIVDRIQNDKNDPFGFVADMLIEYVPYEAAKPLLSEEAEEAYPGGEGWDVSPLTKEAVTEEMRSYMKFAWGKVRDHRGLSASRSVVKMAAWLWILDEDDFQDLYRVSLSRCNSAWCEPASHAAMVKIDVPQGGRWRVALDTMLWIDVWNGDTKLTGVLCEHHGCQPLRKIVQYDLQPGAHWVVLLGKAAGESGVLVTRVSD